jgi:Helix-turn-helix domain
MPTLVACGDTLDRVPRSSARATDAERERRSDAINRNRTEREWHASCQRPARFDLAREEAQAATLFGVTQPRISDLVLGKIDRFSIDTLVAMLGHAGIRIQIVVGRRSKVA